MLKAFPIDFVRAVFENQFRKNSTNTELFNNEDISLFSFYEHLSTQEEVDRYVELYKDLVGQQNKTNKLGFGIVAVTDTPSITNIATSFVSPFEWSCTIRCTMANRDKMMQTIYQLIEDLKGKKVDVAQLDNGKIFPVGTLFNEGDNAFHSEDYIGEVDFTNATTLNTSINALLTSLSTNYGLTFDNTKDLTLFASDTTDNSKLREVFFDGTGGAIFEEVTTHSLIPSHTSYEKYKLDLSFDDLKINEPFTLNSQEYCEISFGGSATLCNESVRLGNDLVRLLFSKYKVKGASDYTFTANSFRIEPLELPSNNNANNIPNQLRSNYFKVNSHTDSVAISIQYSFLCDLSNTLLNQWYNYARYGENNLTNAGLIQQNSITPNIIYTIKEMWNTWGVIEEHTFKAKIIDDIQLENSESDALTMSLTMQIQGAND